MKKPGMSFMFVHLSQNGPAKQIDFDYGSIFQGDTGSRYRVKGALRTGGNAVVFDAEELSDDGSVLRPCAIKCLKQLYQARRDRFANEVRIHKQLNSPYIAEFYDKGTVALGDDEIEVPWVALSLGGKSLWDIRSEGALLRDEAKTVAIEATKAIAYLHSLGIIHRDIKPENFIQSTNWQDTAFPCKMIDFGIAKFIDEDVAARPFDQLTRYNEFVGPQSFASPELIQYGRDKNTVVDEKSDYYQLGLLIWFLFTGRILGGIPSKRLDPTGGPIHTLVSDLVQELPEDRPDSLDEVISRLSEI